MQSRDHHRCISGRAESEHSPPCTPMIHLSTATLERISVFECAVTLMKITVNSRACVCICRARAYRSFNINARPFVRASSVFLVGVRLALKAVYFHFSWSFRVKRVHLYLRSYISRPSETNTRRLAAKRAWMHARIVRARQELSC